MAKLSALQKNFHEAAATDNVAKLKNMINNLINSKDDEGKMPLLKASNKETISYLIQIGADVNVNDTGGRTALHKAAKNNQIEVVKCLIENGANINVKDKNEFTPLHRAAEYGPTEIVNYLIENGAMINSVNIKAPAATPSMLL